MTFSLECLVASAKAFWTDDTQATGHMDPKAGGGGRYKIRKQWEILT